MSDFLQEILEWQGQVLAQLVSHIGPVLVWAVIIGGFIAFVIQMYGAISSRLRRNEVARCFLHLLEIGLKQGRSVEQTTVSVSQNRVNTMGVYFHLLAAHIEQGLRLDQALDEVPRFLPHSVKEMIKAAAEIGQLERALPLCRETLNQGLVGARTAVNKAVVVFCLFPVGAFVIFTMTVYVVPKLKDIARDMLGFVPHRFEVLTAWSSGLIIGLLVVWCVIAIGWFCEGKALLQFIEPRFKGIIDFLLPWRRKRLQRNFSVMLALALDSGVPEERAISLAAQATGNSLFMRRAQEVVIALGDGLPLQEAVAVLDETGEFAWRLRNAFHTPVKLLNALAGWHEALEMRAARQEETFSHVASSILILINGCAVGLLGASLFIVLITILEEGL